MMPGGPFCGICCNCPAHGHGSTGKKQKRGKRARPQVSADMAFHRAAASCRDLLVLVPMAPAAVVPQGLSRRGWRSHLLNGFRRLLDEGWAAIDAEGMEFFAWVETHFPRALLQAVAAIEAICVDMPIDDLLRQMSGPGLDFVSESFGGSSSSTSMPQPGRSSEPLPPSLPEQVDAVAEAVAADGSQEECIVLDDALDALVELGESFLLVPELESSGPASGEVGIVAPVDLCTDNEAETAAASSGAASLLALPAPPQNSATRFFALKPVLPAEHLNFQPGGPRHPTTGASSAELMVAVHYVVGNREMTRKRQELGLPWECGPGSRKEKAMQSLRLLRAWFSQRPWLEWELNFAHTADIDQRVIATWTHGKGMVLSFGLLQQPRVLPDPREYTMGK